MAKEGVTRGPPGKKKADDRSGKPRSKGAGDKGGGSKSGTTHGR